MATTASNAFFCGCARPPGPTSRGASRRFPHQDPYHHPGLHHQVSIGWRRDHALTRENASTTEPPVGVEPTTSRLQDGCSGQLSYRGAGISITSHICGATLAGRAKRFTFTRLFLHSDRPARSCRWKGSRFTMATVTYDKASRIYPGSERPAVNELNLEIGDGEFLVLVGPSGCGKSTSLRMLAGLEDVDKGRILIEGKDVTNLPPKSRDIAMVFQNYALYPHMSVYENMAFALKLRKTSKSEIDRRVKEAAQLLQLDEYLSRKP